MYCKKCGTENVDEAIFCENCGSALRQDENAQVKPTVKKKRKKIWIAVAGIIVLTAVIVAIFFVMQGKKEKKQEEAYKNYISEAEKYIEILDYEHAEDSYLNAISIDPKQKQPYLKLADIYVDQEKFGKAKEILIQAKEATTDSEINEKQEEVIRREEEREKFAWVVEPYIEADNIYYLNSEDAWGNPVNELNKQLEKNYGYAAIKKGNAYGLIDFEGNLLDEMNFQSVNTHLSNYHVVYNEPHYDWRTGTETTEFDLTDEGLAYSFDHGDASNLYGGVYYWNNGLARFDIANKMPEPEHPIALVESSDAINDWKELAEWCRNHSGKYAIYTDGKLITDFVYEECGSYSEGLFAVCQDGKWGYVNQDGKIVIPIEYDASWKEYIPYSNCETGETKGYCYAASDGYVVLCQKDKWELRDVRGEEVISQGLFDEIRPVCDGKCWVKKNGRWGVIELKLNLKQEEERNSSAYEETIQEFFYTWLDQWKFENGEFVLLDYWGNNDVGISSCLTYISSDSDLYSSLESDSDFGGRLSLMVAVNIQKIELVPLEDNRYKVIINAYMTQNTVDQAMYNQMVEKGYSILQYEVAVNDEGLITELNQSEDES